MNFSDLFTSIGVKINASAECAAIHGKVFVDRSKPETAKPYCVIDTVHSVAKGYFGHTTLDSVFLQFNIYSSNSTTALRTASDTLEALDKLLRNASDKTVGWIATYPKERGTRYITEGTYDNKPVYQSYLLVELLIDTITT